MRAGVLSNEQIIEFLNDNFINTWVGNAALGRIHTLREPIAKRSEREGKTFDTSHPLAQAIIKGWKTGSKKGSSVDCFVISPEFELMGKQPISELHDDIKLNRHLRDAYYLNFFKEALDGIQPGLGNIILNSDKHSQDVLDVFRSPVVGYADYTVVIIDTRAFENGGTLRIDIEAGRADADGYFYLVDDDDELPTTEKVTRDMVLARTWLEPDDTGQLTYQFEQGQLFKLGATGCNYRSEKGTTNAFKARISVKEN